MVWYFIGVYIINRITWPLGDTKFLLSCCKNIFSGFFTQLHKLCSLRRSFLHFHFISAVHIWFISYTINTHFFYGNIWTHNWPAPNVSGFIAQLVERRTGIARSRVQTPLKSWIFFSGFLRNCINCIHCDDHFFIFKNISLVHCAHSWNIFQHSKRNFRISAQPCNILYLFFPVCCKIRYTVKLLLMATSLQPPLPSVPKMAVVERFGCNLRIMLTIELLQCKCQITTPCMAKRLLPSFTFQNYKARKINSEKLAK